MSTAKHIGRIGALAIALGGGDFRSTATRMTASIGATALVVTAAAVPLPVSPAVKLSASTALILGGTGLPTPGQSYVDAAEQLYLVPNGYGAYTPQVLITPEQAYPITGVNSLTADASGAQGVTILDSAINQQIAADNHVVVFGYSQGAGVASQEAAQLASSSDPPSPSQLSFVLVGDPSFPNGGFNQRFEVPGALLSLPSLGATFNYAPAAGSPYPTAVYTQEYDGFADFPQYPINLLADLNAYVGIFTQHFGYVDLTPQQISSAIALPTTGNTTTRYYMIPTANLPLLAPVRLIPLIGNPLADLLQPDLRVLVNLGYGSITDGWSPGPANVPTPFGLFPTNINPVDVLTALANGAVQGVTNALNDLKTPQLFDLSSLSEFLAGFHTVGFTPSNSPSLLQLLAGFSALGNGGVPVSSTGGVVNTLTSVIANDLAVAKPLVDTALAIGASLPAYDAELFASQLAAGNLLNAVGLPIAADLALVPYALIAGAVFPIVGAVATTVTQLAELAGLEPNPTGTAATTGTAASTANTDTRAVTQKVTPVTPQVTPVTAQVAPVTPQVGPVTPQVAPVTAEVTPATPKASPVTAEVTPATPKASPVTPQVATVIPQVSPVTPKITATTTTTSPSGTQPIGSTFGTGNKPTPAAKTTTPPAGSHHGKDS
jgi:hypothetical protein